MTAALAAGSTMVAVAFATCLAERWMVRRQPHELAWTIALTLFACGSLALWAGASLGWAAWSFRLFYAFGAVVNVPFLALGTIELLSPRAGRVARVAVPLFCAFAAGVVLSAPVHGRVAGEALPQGSDVFGALPRVLAATSSGLGALVVFAGSAWSALRRRRVAGNVVIALGTATLSMSGLLNSALGEMQAFAVTLTAGVTILFAGFLLATSPLPRRRLLGLAQLAA